MKILIINGHPYRDSLSIKIAKAYKKGAEKVGHDVKLTNLFELDFDPILHSGYHKIQPLEKDLLLQQERIKWCSHLILVTPVWWMNVPALLKGFFDRILLPGFAFRYKKIIGGIAIPKGLLKGRTATVIYTQGAPKILPLILYGDSFWKTIKRGTLGFCGFSSIKRIVVPDADKMDKKTQKKWLFKIEKIGQRGE